MQRGLDFQKDRHDELHNSSVADEREKFELVHVVLGALERFSQYQLRNHIYR
jgi:hypothetical protein